jgi:hypothetical protein
MTHACNKEEVIEEIKITLGQLKDGQEKLEGIKKDRRETQRKHDLEVDQKLTDIKSQISALIELNSEVQNIKTAWKVGKSVGLGLASLIAVMGIIFGGIFAFKDWIKK